LLRSVAIRLLSLSPASWSQYSSSNCCQFVAVFGVGIYNFVFIFTTCQKRHQVLSYLANFQQKHILRKLEQNTYAVHRPPHLVFRRPYLSNGRAVVMVVVRTSVRLSSVGHGCTVPKRCKIRSKFLLIIDRKSHIGFQMT